MTQIEDQTDKLSPIVTAVLLSCLCLIACTPAESEASDREVVICIVDDFSHHESHGQRVKKILEENSFHRCAIRMVDVNRGNPAIANGYLFALRNVLTYVTDHPDRLVIVNISMGSYTKHAEEAEVIGELAEKGVMIVASAGNDNTDKKLYPAAFDETVAVAATHKNRKADYSNFGDYIDIAARGLETVTIKRREPVKGVTPQERIHYQITGGTSFAAPRVAGLWAYLLNQRPDLEPAEAMEVIKKHATPVRERGMNPPLAGVYEIGLFSTLLREDPLYQKLFGFQILSLVVMLFLLYVCDRERALFYFGLVFLGPLMVGLNLVLIASLGLIRGSGAGMAAILIAYPATCLYFLFKRKQNEKQRQLELEASTGHRPR